MHKQCHFITLTVILLLTIQAGVFSQEQYFTGTGGRGISLAVLTPAGTGLTQDEDYIPALIQGVISSNFHRLSAIAVFDRQAQERIILEMEDGIYRESDDVMRYGEVIPTQYMLSGSITRTPQNYILNLRIASSSDGRTQASHQSNVSRAAIDNLSAIGQASADLLGQMGVSLTPAGRNFLAQASQSAVEGQTALARGVTAQRQGTAVAALSYYFQAAALDPALLEATGRSSILSANITSGNIGADVRNDIAWRNAWVQNLRETEEFFFRMFSAADPPYTLFYSTGLEQGNINYQAETVDLSFPINHRARGIWFSTIIDSFEKAAQAVYDGLNATGRTRDWGLANWPRTGVTNTNPFNRHWNFDNNVVFELLNEQNRVIGSNNSQNSWSFLITQVGNNRITAQFNRDTFSTIQFRGVRANDISDNLTIRIASVNNTRPENARFPITALSESGFNGYRNALNNFRIENGVVRGFTSFSPQRGYTYTLRFPPEIWGETDYGIIAIGDRAFERMQLSSIEIPNSVTWIGERAFYGNPLFEVTIPDRVNTIGREAFLISGGVDGGINIISPNSITIGSNVRIRTQAFGTRFEDFYYNTHDRRAGTYTQNRPFIGNFSWDLEE